MNLPARRHCSFSRFEPAINGLKIVIFDQKGQKKTCSDRNTVIAVSREISDTVLGETYFFVLFSIMGETTENRKKDATPFLQHFRLCVKRRIYWFYYNLMCIFFRLCTRFLLQTWLGFSTF